jgi:hypothetical protein
MDWVDGFRMPGIRTLELDRPGIQPADMTLVIDEKSGRIFGAAEKALALVAVDGLDHGRGQRGLEPLGVSDPTRDADAGTCEDKADHAFRPRREHVFGRQHRAPRLAQDVNAVEADGPTKLRQLADIPLRGPEREVVRPV